MADPLGLVGGSSGLGGAPMPGIPRPTGAGKDAGGASFKDALLKSLNEANAAQVDATRAVEDLTTGQRSDVESVIIATQKADNAFRMLQALRNRMMDAYEEVKQMRV